jgi:hypothetical protein
MGYRGRGGNLLMMVKGEGTKKAIEKINGLKSLMG